MKIPLYTLWLCLAATLSAQTTPNLQDINRGLLGAYMDTSENGATLRYLFSKYGIDQGATPKQVMDGIMFAESSWGLKSYSKDKNGENLGWLQNSHRVVMAREKQDNFGPIDSNVVALRLLYDRIYDFKNGTQTFVEMVRHHYNCGRRGQALKRAAIRSYNAGHKRKKYMSAQATLYLDTVLLIAKGTK